jgi:hypothetical protein
VGQSNSLPNNLLLRLFLELGYGFMCRDYNVRVPVILNFPSRTRLASCSLHSCAGLTSLQVSASSKCARHDGASAKRNSQGSSRAPIRHHRDAENCA